MPRIKTNKFASSSRTRRETLKISYIIVFFITQEAPIYRLGNNPKIRINLINPKIWINIINPKIRINLINPKYG